MFPQFLQLLFELRIHGPEERTTDRERVHVSEWDVRVTYFQRCLLEINVYALGLGDGGQSGGTGEAALWKERRHEKVLAGVSALRFLETIQACHQPTHFSLPKRNPCTSSTGSFSPITVAFTSAPETTINHIVIVTIPPGLDHHACIDVCVCTLNLRVILRLVLLAFDSQLHSVAGQIHFLRPWILEGK